MIVNTKLKYNIGDIISFKKFYHIILIISEYSYCIIRTQHSSYAFHLYKIYHMSEDDKRHLNSLYDKIDSIGNNKELINLLYGN